MTEFEKKKTEVVTIPKVKLDNFIEQMESVAGNIQLALEDKNWMNMVTALTEEPDEYERKTIVARSRIDYKRYPLYKHAVELDKSFMLGSGINRPESKNPFIQYIVDYIWNARENKRTFTGFMAMENIIEQKTLSGEIFFKIYVNEDTGENVVRIERDTNKIVDVITKPEDKDAIRFYRYKMTRTEYDFDEKKVDNSKKVKTKEMFIPDIYNDDMEDVKKNGSKAYDKKNKVRLYGFLVAFGNAAEVSALRGYPIYMQSLKWFKAHKEVAEDVATMLKAKSRFAWENKFPEGVGKSVVETMMNAAKSISDTGNVNSTTPAVGSELYVNEKYMKKQPIDIKHEPGMFKGTSDILMQAIASGTDKNEHYYGNAENANLATATAMELPMLKAFQRLQQELAEVIEWVMKFLILKIIEIKGVDNIKTEAENNDFDLPKAEDEDGKALLAKFINQMKDSTWENLDISVFMPDILGDDTSAMIKAVSEGVLAGTIDERVGSRVIYGLLGIRNIDEIIAEQYGDYDEDEEVDEVAMQEETNRVAAMVKKQIDDEKKLNGEDE